MKRKPFLTTSQAARVLYCSQQTVIRAFDKGLLQGHRLLGSRFRRLISESVFDYAKQNGLPEHSEVTLRSWGILERE